MSYGFSIWYVPYNYTQLKQRYSIKHIPHITIKTNLIREDATHFYTNTLFPYETHIYVTDPIVIFPSIHKQDPLKAIGWWCNTLPKNQDIEWKPHLSIEYFIELPSRLPIYDKAPQEPLLCYKIIADTTSANPEEWHLL
jgi:hypothetical protein